MNDKNAVATTQASRQPPAKPTVANIVATMDNRHKDQIVALLGKNGDYENFKQVVAMAVTKTPALLDCSPSSVMQACLGCASDGLVPDGKQAALVIYGSEAVYQPMVGGIVLSLMRTGLVKDIQVDCVYRGEYFENVQGSDSHLDHRPSLDRGGDEDIMGAYAVIKTINGGEFKRAMGRNAIMKVRAIAKSKKVWDAWMSEMFQKTVLRNLGKLLPKELNLPVLHRADVLYDLDKPTPPPVMRTQSLAHRPQDVIEEPEDTKNGAHGQIVDGKGTQGQNTEEKPDNARTVETVDSDGVVTDPPTQVGDTPKTEPEPQGVLAWAIKAANQARDWDNIIWLITTLNDEKTALWTAASAIGEDKRLYAHIRGLAVYKDGFPGDRFRDLISESS